MTSVDTFKLIIAAVLAAFFAILVAVVNRVLQERWPTTERLLADLPVLAEKVFTNGSVIVATGLLFSLARRPLREAITRGEALAGCALAVIICLSLTLILSRHTLQALTSLQRQLREQDNTAPQDPSPSIQAPTASG